ncbi:Fe-S cluster assembly protein SufD [Candidatus Woesearchaeota archaeon]|nr:Fe-S cluster assembly protein SufD [Candidatus Woesearchaeota archaeon]
MQSIASYSEPLWLAQRRADALKCFNELAMPKLKYGLTIKIDLGDFSFENCSPAEVPEQKIVAPVGVDILDIADAVKKYPELLEKKFITLLNNNDKSESFHKAFLKKATVVVIPRTTVVAEPIEIRSFFSNTNVEHVLIVAQPNSKATIVCETTNNSNAGCVVNSYAVEIFAGAGSTINFLGLQNCDEKTYTFSTKRAVIENDAAVNWLDCNFGSKVCLSETTSVLKGAGSSSNVYGLFFGSHNQKFDMHLESVHEGAHTTSDMLVKGVLDDDAKAIYRGALKIMPSANGASGYQKEDVTLLSPKAEADSIPELRINNNEVRKCTHGASIGQVDAEKLFYLMSRGLPKKEAVKKMIEGFFAALLAKAENDGFSEQLKKLVEAKLYVK